MKAIVATGYGDTDVFELREVEKPQPKENEVLVKVYCSSASRADTMMRTGKPYIGRLFIGIFKPKHPIPGTGFAGVVEFAGSGVTKFKAGDKVFGEKTVGFSTNAEYVAVPEDGIILPLPQKLSFAEGATVCDGHLTSLNFLREVAHIKKGQHVLINAASGSLGSAAVQLAKYYGARVTGVCSTANIELVKSLGADDVIDYKKEDFTRSNNTYDIVFDTIGKSSFSQCKRILHEDGMYLSPVLKFSTLLQMIRSSLFGKKKALFDATGAKPAKKLKALLAELVGIINSGKLKTIIDRQFPLEKLAQAHDYISSGHKKGNVVITIHQPGT